VPWGGRELLYGFLGAVSIYLLVSALLWPLGARYEEESTERAFILIVANIFAQIGVLVLLFVLLQKYGRVLLALGARAPRIATPGWFPSGRLAWAVTAAFLMSLAARLAVMVYVIIAREFESEFLLPEQQIPEEVFESVAVQVAAGISIVGLAPIAEEVFFRGFLFAGLRKLTGVWVAALLSSLLFAVVHAQSGLIIPFTIVGLMLAYLYHRSRSIYLPIGMHFFFNAVSFLFLVFVPEFRTEQ
jgi:membrane protease YdiL (CAAX protease family)